MYNSYVIEKIAESKRHETLAAADARRRARAFRSTTPAATQPGSPAGGTIRIPRPRRWFGLATAR